MNSPAYDDPPFPHRFGRYVLLELLAEGGMGRVYLAASGSIGNERLCVIKRFGSAYSHFSTEDLPLLHERFRRETEITMALSHEGIASTFDSGNERGEPFLVQEFINGLTLSQLILADIPDHQLPVPLASHIICELAKALSYIHDFEGRGLLHRDISPENVMVSTTGQVKLIDFGIAKATAVHTDLTRPNHLPTKVAWAPPEVLAGKKPARSSDLFSLGLVHWYLLTGRRPSSSPADGTPTATLSLALPSTFNPRVDKQIDQISRKATAINPLTRYQTAAHLLADLSATLPPGFCGKSELAACVDRVFNPMARRSVETFLPQVRSLLGSPTGPIATQPADSSLSVTTTTSVHRGTRTAVLVIILVAAIAASVVFLLRSPRLPSRGDQPAPRVAVPPPAPVPVSSDASPPAKPEAVQDSLPKSFQSPDASLFPAPTATLPPRSATRTWPPKVRVATKALTPETPPTEPKPRTAPEAAPQVQTEPTSEQLVTDASLALRRGDVNKAISLARAAIAAHASAEAYVLLARAHLAKDDTGAARKAILRALSLSPSHREAQHLLQSLP